MTSTERFVDASVHVATISALRALTIQRDKSNFVDEGNTMDTLGVTYIQEVDFKSYWKDVKSVLRQKRFYWILFQVYF